jgi:hypothetical protein
MPFPYRKEARRACRLDSMDTHYSGVDYCGFGWQAMVVDSTLPHSDSEYRVGIYVWTCITENLGRNKRLGLLMLLPIINFVFLGIPAFSKTEKPGYSGVRTIPA